MGLAGDAAFRIKVSPDGSQFATALEARPEDGVVTVPCLMSGRVTVAEGTAVAIPTPGAGGMIAVSMVDTDYPQAAHSGIFAYDAGATLSLVTLAGGGSLENLGAQVFTGTTGTAGQSSLAAAAGALQLENRHGAVRHYAFTFINTF
ncbi:MAG: hypothetical protein AAFU63_00165 [Pseudomonadota bacterium]